MTPLLLLVLVPVVVWLIARLSDLDHHLRRLRTDVARLQQQVDGLVDEAARRRSAEQGAPSVAPAAAASSTPPSAPPELASPPITAGPVVGGTARPLTPETVPVADVGERKTDVDAAPLAPPAAATPTRATSLEGLIGGRWLLYIGMATILIGASYFVKLALDNEWVTPVMRLLIGGTTGIALIAAGPLFRRRGYHLYGQILAGGGIALLYICVYAAFNYYALLGSTTAFALMVAITAAAAAIADYESSQGLAVMAVGGGFLTPFLVSSGRDAQVALFTYDAILIAGTMLLARRRNWPALNALSFVFTVATLTAWGGRYYRPVRWLTTYAFLTLFVAMFIYIRHESRRWGTVAATSVAHLLILAPVLYHVFALGLLFDHGTALLIYLVLATAAGLAVNARADAAALRLVLWFAAMLPFYAWAAAHRGWPAVAICSVAVAVYAMHLAAQSVVLRTAGRLQGIDLALLYVSAVGLYAAFEAALEHRRIALLPLLALALAAWNAALAVWLRARARDLWPHTAVLAAAFAAIAIARQFDGPAAAVGWAVIAAGLLWLALTAASAWLRAAGVLLLATAIAQLVRDLFSPPAVSHVVLINPAAVSTLFVVAVMAGVARAYRTGAAADARHMRAGLIVAANLLALTLITAEIQAFWQVRSPGRSGYLAQHVMTSLAWGLYAVVSLVAGLRMRYAPIRYLAMAVLGVTILKLFLLDLAALDQAYRVLSAIGIGVLLLIASFLYQRFKDDVGG